MAEPEKAKETKEEKETVPEEIVKPLNPEEVFQHIEEAMQNKKATSD